MPVAMQDEYFYYLLMASSFFKLPSPARLVVPNLISPPPLLLLGCVYVIGKAQNIFPEWMGGERLMGCLHADVFQDSNCPTCFYPRPRKAHCTQVTLRTFEPTSPSRVLSGLLALPSLSPHTRVPYCSSVAWGSCSSKMFCEALPASSSLGQPLCADSRVPGNSTREAQRGLLLDRSHLCLACSGKRKTKASCESRPLIATSPLTPFRI